MSALWLRDAVGLDGGPVSLRAVDGVVTEMGEHVTGDVGDEVLDGRGDVLLPGLVNGHTHAAMTLFRGYGGDLPLMEWLEQKIWPAEARLTDDDVYWGTRLACVEMIRTGTVRFWDMYWRPVAVARAVRDAGLRATIGPPLLDSMDATRSDEACKEAGDWLEELEQHAPWVQPSLAPHGIYTASEPTLRWVAEQSAARDVAVHLHFLETESEVTGCVERTGERPGAYLDRLGFLSPRLVLAHGVWMEDEELELVASAARPSSPTRYRTSSSQSDVCFHMPASRAHGIPVALGTDGASSNNSLDLLGDLKVLALLQKHATDDPAALPADEAWQVATGALAPALGATPSVTVGAPADFLLARATAPELAPGHVLDNLVYAASGHVVRSTVVAGRVLMEDGVVPDEQDVRAHVVESATRLGVV